MRVACSDQEAAPSLGQDELPAKRNLRRPTRALVHTIIEACGLPLRVGVESDVLRPRLYHQSDQRPPIHALLYLRTIAATASSALGGRWNGKTVSQTDTARYWQDDLAG